MPDQAPNPLAGYKQPASGRASPPGNLAADLTGARSLSRTLGTDPRGGGRDATWGPRVGHPDEAPAGDPGPLRPASGAELPGEAKGSPGGTTGTSGAIAGSLGDSRGEPNPVGCSDLALGADLAAALWAGRPVPPPLSEHEVSLIRQATRRRSLGLDPLPASHLCGQGGDACSILAIRRESPDRGGVGGWSLVVPAGWIPPLWLALAYQGATPAGLLEWGWISRQQECLRYPEDYPDTQAGNRLDRQVGEEQRAHAMRRPPGRRPAGPARPLPWLACLTAAQPKEGLLHSANSRVPEDEQSIYVARTDEALARAMWRPHDPPRPLHAGGRVSTAAAVPESFPVSGTSPDRVLAPAHPSDAPPRQGLSTRVPLQGVAEFGTAAKDGAESGTSTKDSSWDAIDVLGAGGGSAADLGSGTHALLLDQARESRDDPRVPGSGERDRCEQRSRGGPERGGWVWRAKGAPGGEDLWDQGCLICVDLQVPGRGVPVEGTEIYTKCGNNPTSRAVPRTGRVAVIGLRREDARGFDSPGGVRMAHSGRFLPPCTSSQGADPAKAQQAGDLLSVSEADTPNSKPPPDGPSLDRQPGAGSNAGFASPQQPSGTRQRAWKLGKRKCRSAVLAKDDQRMGRAGNKAGGLDMDKTDGTQWGGLRIGFVTSGVPRGSWGLRGCVGFVSAKQFYRAASSNFQAGWKFGRGRPLPVALRNPGEQLVYLGLATPRLFEGSPDCGPRYFP
eukprot:jgi/Botrbrau1/7498/Bobra.0095s0034.1